MVSEESRYLHPDIETMPRAALEALQWERLKVSIELAYARGSLVRAKWEAAGVTPDDIRSLADFSRLVPFITKDDIRAHREATGDPFGGVLCIDKSELRSITGTSGTTGDPTLISRRDLKSPLMESGFSRSFWDLGLRPGEYGIVINTTMRGSPMSPLRDFGMIPVTFDHDPAEIPRLVELIRTYRPTLMLCLSTPLLIGLEQFEAESGLDLAEVFGPFKAILWGGEPLGPRGQGLTERWRMNIFNIVSLGDSTIAIEAANHTGAYAWEDEVFVEHLDPQTLLPAADGALGELIVTPLQNTVDPLIRYRSEDLVWLTRAPCPSGRTHLRYKVEGRASDQIVIGDRSFLPRSIWPAIEAIPETQAALFQIVKPKLQDDRLHLRVGYAAAPDLADLEQRVAAEVTQRLGVQAQIELVPNAELLKLGPPHKIPRIVKL